MLRAARRGRGEPDAASWEGVGLPGALAEANLMVALPMGSTMVISPDRHGGALLGPVLMALPMSSTVVISPLRRAGAWEAMRKEEKKRARKRAKRARSVERAREWCRGRGERGEGKGREEKEVKSPKSAILPHS